jgi:hypothetical protein
MNHRTSAQRRTSRRRPVLFDAPAEVLESRELLTATGVPYLVFAAQPQNAIAGHSLSFTVDVMINRRTEFGTAAEVDTAFNGLCVVSPFSPTTSAPAPSMFYTPYNYPVTPGPNSPLFRATVMNFVNGVANTVDNELPVALDSAGTYQLSATASAPLPEVSSNSFTISPFTATDRLVFLKAPSTATVDAPISVTVAVEDEYGNIDTSVTNVPVNLLAGPGNLSTAELKNGEATFNDAFFVAAGPDTLLAFASPPTGGILIGTDVVQVFGASGDQS